MGIHLYNKHFFLALSGFARGPTEVFKEIYGAVLFKLDPFPDVKISVSEPYLCI